MTEFEKAHSGLSLLKQAILEHLTAHPEGLRNVEIAEALGLRSDFEGEQKDYLSWSLIGLLVNEGKVLYRKVGQARKYFAQGEST